jgi:outer membrane protein OmpA-like peptidoglycan-associated protein
VKGTFTVYQRDRDADVFQQREQYPSEFVISPLGRYAVPKQFYMPNLRHVPSFPGRDVNTGDRWSADADLVLNSFSVPFKLTFPAEYRLENIERKDGTEIAEIRFGFVMDMNLAGGNYPADFPLRIQGRDEGTLFWDVAGNRPLGMKEKYRIVFIFPSGGKATASTEFQMLIDTAVNMYKPVTPEQKEKQKDALKKEVPKGIDVDTDRRGLVLRLGDVFFDFDSAALRSESKAALDAIAGILMKKYPGREIIVEGHTDGYGGADYNRRLSMDRAENVARYLKKRSGTDNLSYRGYGADRPIAGNDTKENRQKNRRVEIIIKLQ